MCAGWRMSQSKERGGDDVPVVDLSAQGLRFVCLFALRRNRVTRRDA